ncbi:hypothetical protein [uncultured Psychroserpens sp.]|uniref:hypothetical protein n=1 Tax=uncultured Psychroserpens sp. TaxID=255436 RepID=UPI00261A5ACB|nr:hypothetical protein [uncultured Psychroserpens sp.]
MIQAKHCDLCEHPKRSLKKGLTCGLTNKKPDFKISCSDIKFSNSFKEYLPELSNQIENVKKRKAFAYLTFILASLLGLIIIVGSYPILEKALKKDHPYSIWKHLEVVLFFYFVGSGIISMGLWSLYKHRKALKKLESEKRELNMVLSNYKLDIESLNSKKTPPQQRV